MKFYLLILLFILFVVVAIFVYFKYYFRFVLYKDMVYICKNFKNNISFNKNKVGLILDECLNNVSLYTRYIVNHKKENKLILLSRKDYDLLQKFFASIGKGDVDFEINNITYFENNFNELKIESQEKLNKDGKMYLKLIIGIGLAICIILI